MFDSVALLEWTYECLKELSGSYAILPFLTNPSVFLIIGDPNKPSGFRSVKAPVTKVAASIGNAQKLPMCDKCGTGIV